MQIWKHSSGKLYREVGQHGPWLKFQALNGGPILYVDHEFIVNYTKVELH